MAGWNGAGQVIRSDSVTEGAAVWQAARARSQRIEDTHHDAHDEVLAGAIEKCLNRDGENAMAANLAMGGFKSTNVGAGQARSDSVNLGQVQDLGFQWAGTAGGTTNALTVAVTPAITAYVSGKSKIRFVVGTTNTAAGGVTIDVNGVGVVALEQRVGMNPPARSLVAGALVEAVYVSTTPGFVITSGLYLETPLPRGYIDGFVLSNAADVDHDIAVAVGEARSEYSAAPGGRHINFVTASPITKRIDAAWAVGSGNGGLDSGTVAGDSWYAIYGVARPSLPDPIDFIFSLSADPSAVVPTDYSLSRRIGWVRTDTSGNILPFKHYPGGEFRYVTPPALNVDDTVTTTPSLHTLSAPPNTEAIINVQVRRTAAAAAVLIMSRDMSASLAVSDNATPLASHGYRMSFDTVGLNDGRTYQEMRVRVDASSQVRIVADNSLTLRVATLGWVDRRGRDAT